MNKERGIFVVLLITILLISYVSAISFTDLNPFNWFNGEKPRLSNAPAGSGQLVTYYPFNFENFSQQDVIGKISNSGLIFNGGRTFAFGKIRNAYFFNGLNSFFVANDFAFGSGNTPNNGGGNKAFAISLWVKDEADPSSQKVESIIEFTDETGLRNGLAINSAGNPVVYFNGNEAQSSNTLTIRDSNWHHLVGMYDGVTTSLYLNGQKLQLQGNILQNIPRGSPKLNLSIGASTIVGSQNMHFFKGGIDEVLIYNGTISESEIQKLYFNSVKLINLPSNFNPIIGISDPIKNRTILDDNSGNFYTSYYNSKQGVVFSSENSNFPNNFKPTVGYYHNFAGGRIVLWNSSGAYFIYNGNSWNGPLAPTGASGDLPIGFKPTVGYYHNFAGGRIVLWNSSGTYFIYNGTSWKGPLMPTGANGDLPIGFKPTVGYYHALGESKIVLWNSSGTYFVYKGNSWSGPFTTTPSGLPSGIPNLGYYDSGLNKLILWYGNKAYESSDGQIFRQAAVDYNNPLNLCNPNWQCSQWNTCTNNQQTRTCSDTNNCGIIQGKPAESQTCTSPPTQCTPSCSGKECGSNGCGGVCGTCTTNGEICDVNFQCSAQTCIDSDVANFPLEGYSFGNITYNYNSNLVVKNDTCFNETVVTEWSCNINSPENRNITCLGGCLNGKCLGTPQVTCIDSDNGKKFKISGWVNYTLDGGNYSEIDSCISETAVLEQYCEDDIPYEEEAECLSGEICSYGKCIDEDNGDGSCTGSSCNTIGGPCNEGAEKCQGDKYILCTSGQWSDPINIDGKCGYSFNSNDADVTSGTGDTNLETDSQEKGFTIYIVIALIILILAIGGVIIYIIMKNKKETNSSQKNNSNNSAPPMMRGPPPTGPTFQQTQRVFDRR